MSVHGSAPNRTSAPRTSAAARPVIVSPASAPSVAAASPWPTTLHPVFNACTTERASCGKAARGWGSQAA